MEQLNPFLLNPLLEYKSPLKTPCKICKTTDLNEEYTILTCKCGQFVHPRCCKVYPKDYLAKGVLVGDRYWIYTCSSCHLDGEILKRPTIMWISLLELVMYHLLKTNNGIIDNMCYWKYNLTYIPIRYYDAKDDILPILIDYWPLIMCKDAPKQFVSKFNGTLSANVTRYFLKMNDKPSFWSLRNPVIPNPDPRIQTRVRTSSKDISFHLQNIQQTCLYETFTKCFSDVCPIIDFYYEEATIQKLDLIVNKSTDQSRLLRKLKLRKRKRNLGLPLLDLDIELEKYYHNTAINGIEIDVIKHPLSAEVLKKRRETVSAKFMKLNQFIPKIVFHRLLVDIDHLQVGQQITQSASKNTIIEFVKLTTEMVPMCNTFIKTHYAPQSDSILIFI